MGFFKSKYNMGYLKIDFQSKTKLDRLWKTQNTKLNGRQRYLNDHDWFSKLKSNERQGQLLTLYAAVNGALRP